MLQYSMAPWSWLEMNCIVHPVTLCSVPYHSHLEPHMRAETFLQEGGEVRSIFNMINLGWESSGLWFLIGFNIL